MDNMVVYSSYKDYYLIAVDGNPNVVELWHGGELIGMVDAWEFENLLQIDEYVVEFEDAESTALICSVSGGVVWLEADSHDEQLWHTLGAFTLEALNRMYKEIKERNK